jgi:hypothetical protein
MKYSRLDKALGIAMKAAIWCIIILVFAMFLSGCGTTPYIEGGVHHVFTDLNTHNPAGTLRIGVEKNYTSSRVDCGYTHFSMVTEGYPFNSRPEPYYDSAGCTVRLLLR